MKYRALALDLDGTLTTSKKEITEKTKETIKKAIESGVSIVLASGRPVLGIRNIAKQLNLQEAGGYILAYNGAKILECKSGKVIFEKLLPMEHYHDICECGKKFGLNVLTYDENDVIAESDEEFYIQKEAFNNSARIRKVECLEKFVTKPVEKFMIVGQPEKIDEALNYMKSKFINKLNVFCSEPYFMEITSLGIEKASSLNRLMEYLKLSSKELMACGDGLNDIPMLEYAGFSVAMENAYPKTKECADYVTLSNDEDGVSFAIEKFILNDM